MTLKLENYLRDNFGKISIAPMIPLFEELEHLQYYIEIEQIRFPNLTVIYDTDVDYFMIPSLSLQPMVENAIRHGIQKNKDSAGTNRVGGRMTPTRCRGARCCAAADFLAGRLR